LAKFSALEELHPSIAPYLMISGYCVSRWAATSVVFSCTYSREDASSKSKPVAQKLDVWSYLFATLTAIGSLMLLKPIILLAFLAAIITKYCFMRDVSKWIGGYTGDVLGAPQQLTELVFYIMAFVLLSVHI